MELYSFGLPSTSIDTDDMVKPLINPQTIQNYRVNPYVLPVISSLIKDQTECYLMIFRFRIL